MRALSLFQEEGSSMVMQQMLIVSPKLAYGNIVVQEIPLDGVCSQGEFIPNCSWLLAEFTFGPFCSLGLPHVWGRALDFLGS